MKKALTTLLLLFTCLLAQAQEFDILSQGQGRNGEYLVKVVMSTKKAPGKDAEDMLKRCAIQGVMFRGIAPYSDYPGQTAIISDPSVERTKKVELDAFWREGIYKNYVNVTSGSSMSIMKNKQTKMTETSAILAVNKEGLIGWLEKNGIIEGFSNLW